MNTTLLFRLAKKTRLTPIIQIPADDTPGAARENINPAVSDGYLQAFKNIQADARS